MAFLVTAMTVRAAVLAAAVRSGRPAEDLVGLVKLAPSVLSDPDARLSHERVAAAWATLAGEVGDDALGITASQLVDSAAVDRLQPLLAQAPTLADAMATFLRYQRLYHSGNRSDATIDGRDWVLTFAVDSRAEPSPHLADFVLASWVRRMRRAAGRDLPVRVARLRRSAPRDPTAHASVFGSAIRFGAREDTLRLDREVARWPIAGTNAALRSILEPQAAARLEAIEPEGSDEAFLRDARAALAIALAEGEPDVERLAKLLATSRRTLQRRFASCGTTFQALLDDLRRDLSLRHLADGRSITDTAFLLGFSELSAFSRAFRRWTGRSPRAARREVARELG